MKINQEYVLRNIAGDRVIIPTGSASQHFNGLITLNEVGSFIWENVGNVADREEMVTLLLEHYNVDEKTAQRDVNGFLDMLKGQGILLED